MTNVYIFLFVLCVNTAIIFWLVSSYGTTLFILLFDKEVKIRNYAQALAKEVEKQKGKDTAVTITTAKYQVRIITKGEQHD